MSKKCTPLWREAHLQVKTLHTPHVRSTFGSSDVEKVHAVVARSAFRSQNVQKHTMYGPLLEVEMSKKCTPLWREAHFQVKMHKTHHVRTTFGRSDVEKCTPLWREARFQVKKHKTHHVYGPLLDVQISFHVAPARDCAPEQNVRVL